MSMAYQVKECGQWTGDINDAVPLSISNILQKQLLIFTSRKEQPTILIEPSLPQQPVSDSESELLQQAAFKLSERKLLLCYMALSGHEHYCPVSRDDWRQCLQGQYTAKVKIELLSVLFCTFKILFKIVILIFKYVRMCETY